MDKLFLEILNMSITSTYIILFIIVVRLLFKGLPKVFSYALWAIVFLRLVLPVSFESMFSLVSFNTQAIPQNIVYSNVPEIHSGIRIIDSVVNSSLPAPQGVGNSINPIQIWIGIGVLIWMTGFAFLVIYSAFSTVKLSVRLKGAVQIQDNIYEKAGIDAPFVFGILNPKIYLPKGISQSEKPYIIKHEQTHIKRFDHVIKILAFLITSIHWFNPFVWLSFFLMGRDMELSCDERVIEEMGDSIKVDYTSLLLSLSTGNRIIGGYPLAFGENNIKSRIKNILNYRKPKLWVTIAAIIILAALAIGLLSNPPDDGKMYKIDKAKVVKIREQVFLNDTMKELDPSRWSSLIDEINNGKWSNLSEEDWPHEENVERNIIITLARDVSVDNKEYMLIIYRNKHKKLLGHEYEYSAALAYNDLTDNIRVWSLPDEFYYKLRDMY